MSTMEKEVTSKQLKLIAEILLRNHPHHYKIIDTLNVVETQTQANQLIRRLLKYEKEGALK